MFMSRSNSPSVLAHLLISNWLKEGDLGRLFTATVFLQILKSVLMAFKNIQHCGT